MFPVLWWWSLSFDGVLLVTILECYPLGQELTKNEFPPFASASYWHFLLLIPDILMLLDIFSVESMCCGLKVHLRWPHSILDCVLILGYLPFSSSCSFGKRCDRWHVPSVGLFNQVASHQVWVCYHPHPLYDVHHLDTVNQTSMHFLRRLPSGFFPSSRLQLDDPYPFLQSSIPVFLYKSFVPNFRLLYRYFPIFIYSNNAFLFNDKPVF